MSVKCIDVRKNHHKTKWLMPWGPNHCEKLKDFDEAVSRQIEANDIVFAVHIPLPSKEMSPWFQFMLFIMQLDIAFKMDNDLSKWLCPLLRAGCGLFFFPVSFHPPAFIQHHMLPGDVPARSNLPQGWG